MLLTSSTGVLQPLRHAVAMQACRKAPDLYSASADSPCTCSHPNKAMALPAGPLHLTPAKLHLLSIWTLTTLHLLPICTSTASNLQAWVPHLSDCVCQPSLAQALSLDLSSPMSCAYITVGGYRGMQTSLTSRKRWFRGSSSATRSMRLLTCSSSLAQDQQTRCMTLVPSQICSLWALSVWPCSGWAGVWEGANDDDMAGMSVLSDSGGSC